MNYNLFKNNEEKSLLLTDVQFLKELETTAMSKSYKMILLEAFLDLNGLTQAPLVSELTKRSWQVLKRRNQLLSDLPNDLRLNENGDNSKWQKYWKNNPINAWCGGNQSNSDNVFFEIKNERFELKSKHSSELALIFESLIREILEFRLSSYQSRKN